jgi:hypothetical protein
LHQHQTIAFSFIRSQFHIVSFVLSIQHPSTKVQPKSRSTQKLSLEKWGFLAFLKEKKKTHLILFEMVTAAATIAVEADNEIQ